jgi:hypothetical protein
MNRFALLLAVSLAVPAFGQEAKPAAAAEPGFSLTVYSTADPATFDPQQLAQQQLMNPYNRMAYRPPGYGVVREVRKIELKEGANDVRFTDVASGIDPTSVSFKSLTDPTASVLEQNYEYDLVSGEKMLEKYRDKQVQVRTKGSGNQGGTTFDGTLMSSDPASIVLQGEGGNVTILQRSEIAHIALAKQETSLITKPTLVWKLNTAKAGAHDAQVTYQTDGITWRADYNVLLNAQDTAADVGAWVTLVNQSGASYPNAKLKLVAGDVQRVRRPDQGGYRGRMEFAAKAAREDTGFQEKSFFEYHLYTLGRPTSVQQNSTKQIELFPSKAGVGIEKTYVYYGLSEQWRYYIAPQPSEDRNLGTEMNKKVDIYLLTHNTEKNGMGIPLPAGRVRVFKKDDADGSLEFVGEDVIQHTPKNEKVMVRMGSAFDIVGERKQTNFESNRPKWITETFEIKLRNHKKEPVKVIIKENLYRWVNWEITASSDKWEKQDSRTMHIPVEVPVDGEKVVTYTVKYTW